jgi:hypothetical protein
MRRRARCAPTTAPLMAMATDMGGGRVTAHARMRGSRRERVHAIRRRTNVDAIMARFDVIERVVIIGGGHIGLEAAAVLSNSSNLPVTLRIEGLRDDAAARFPRRALAPKRASIPRHGGSDTRGGKLYRPGLTA